MTTIKQIKGLANNLLDKNIDLVAAGRNSFWLLPIESIGRLIHLDRTSNPAYCVGKLVPRRVLHARSSFIVLTRAMQRKDCPF